jgi:predicted enzyme related to lactoylglutathione lyase
VKAISFLINITSENPERLREFYQDVVGLVPDPEFGGAFPVVPGVYLGIDGHSEVHGMTKEPPRVLIDFFVDDIDAEQERLAAKGVQFIRDKGTEWWGAIISTFADPDGNLCQLINFDESRMTENPDEAAKAGATA